MVTRGYSWLLVVTGYLGHAVSHCLLQEPKLQNTSGMVEFLSVAAVESAHENEIYFPAQSAIISVSLSSMAPLLTKITSFFPVAEIGVSLSKTMSFAECDFGDGKCTNCPSSNNNKSFVNGPKLDDNNHFEK